MIWLVIMISIFSLLCVHLRTPAAVPFHLFSGRTMRSRRELIEVRLHFHTEGFQIKRTKSEKSFSANAIERNDVVAIQHSAPNASAHRSNESRAASTGWMCRASPEHIFHCVSTNLNLCFAALPLLHSANLRNVCISVPCIRNIWHPKISSDSNFTQTNRSHSERKWLCFHFYHLFCLSLCASNLVFIVSCVCDSRGDCRRRARTRSEATAAAARERTRFVSVWQANIWFIPTFDQDTNKEEW